MKQGVAGHVMQLKTIFKMKLKDFLVMIGLKLLVMGCLENTLRYTTPFNNSENSVMTQALIYLSNSPVFFCSTVVSFFKCLESCTSQNNSKCN